MNFFNCENLCSMVGLINAYQESQDACLQKLSVREDQLPSNILKPFFMLSLLGSEKCCFGVLKKKCLLDSWVLQVV